MTCATVLAGGGCAGVVHHLTVDAAETLRARAQELVGGGVLARAAVLAGLVRTAVVQV